MGLMDALSGEGKLHMTKAPDDVWPICPHCKEELRSIWFKSKALGIMRYLLCPHCRAFLGFANIR